jgi:hypothetical protein
LHGVDKEGADTGDIFPSNPAVYLLLCRHNRALVEIQDGLV